MQGTSNLEDRIRKSTKGEQHKEKRIIKVKNRLWELRDIIKQRNTHIMGIPEREQRRDEQRCKPQQNISKSNVTIH